LLVAIGHFDILGSSANSLVFVEPTVPTMKKVPTTATRPRGVQTR